MSMRITRSPFLLTVHPHRPCGGSVDHVRMRDAIAKYINKVVAAAKGVPNAVREHQRKKALEKLKDPTHKWPDVSG